ncbi:microcystin degradation protein MlrC [Humitalea rosea]|uniref:Microcystinase C n=1 Tax=Humitalea rosea TaxID=990373 RepID=A0A2W7IN29_9PROT|nr:M81 family metallopeptidase [Humitalea rosea]PZW48716.1 microcystin degradation protein MlrC [Humitalea rosea]
MPKIAIARLWFEGNSFTPTPTGWDAFRGREWADGPAAMTAQAGTATELGAAGAWFAARPEWTPQVLRCAAAQPGGKMADEVFETWIAEVTAALRAAPPDGVYLSLHGACVTASDPEADLTLLRAVRAAVGPGVPVTASFDMHANMAPEIAMLLDGASAYRTYPHVDMDAAATRALALLERALSGAAPLHGAIRKLPQVLHSFHMRDAGGPMAEVWAEAGMSETGPVRDASPFGGFAWGDSPYAGPSAMVWAETAAAAEATAARLIASLAARLPRFAVSLPGPEAALATALASPPGLVALLDPADNPLSGGIADTPGLLHLLRDPPVETVLAFLHDPAAVAAAIAAGVGGAIDRPLAGQVTDAFGPPMPFAGVVEALTDGRFVNTGPMERGTTVDLGPTALLRAGRLRVVVTSRKEAAVDPGFFALHGIDLTRVRLLADKGKNHFRAAMAPLCSAIVEADFPGPASLDLAALPFRHVPEGWRRSLG